MQNLITTNYGKNGDSKYDRKLAEIDAGEYMNSVPFKRGLRGCSYMSRASPANRADSILSPLMKA